MTELEKFFNDIMILDTETTGIDSNSEIIEFSASFPLGGNDEFDDVYNYTSRFKPIGEIPAEASAIHFITSIDLENESYYKTKYNEFYPLFDIKKYYVGHNVEFDRNMLKCNHKNISDIVKNEFENDDSWICTLKLAKKMFAEEPEFKNLTLSFLWFKFELHKKCTHKIIPHSAKDDVYMTYKVLSHLINIAIERGLIDENKEIGPQVVKLSNTPITYKTMTIGKYKGMDMTEIEMGYLKWMILNMDIMNPEMINYDADLAYTVEQEITRRMDEGLVTLE